MEEERVGHAVAVGGMMGSGYYSAVPPPPKIPVKLSLSEKFLMLQLLFWVAVIISIVSVFVLAGRDTWLKKHTAFPYTGSGRIEDTHVRSEAYARTSAFVEAHKADVVGSDIFYSDLPFWTTPCKEKEFGVRVVAPIIDPATGESTDTAMYFCYAGGDFVYPANQQAKFYTRSH